MATLSPELVEALNLLLEETRASVECEIALASGAADFVERDAFTTMGREDVASCCALHERLALCESPVAHGVSDASAAILGAEDYDDRLRAFAEYQHAVGQRAQTLASADLDRETQLILQRLAATHVWHTTWSAQRAGEFAATRALEFTRGTQQGWQGIAPTPLTPAIGNRALIVAPPERRDGATQPLPGLERSDSAFDAATLEANTHGCAPTPSAPAERAEDSGTRDAGDPADGAGSDV
jgi:hypothetical protein